jgi:ADP-sugar diphosphatase
VGSLFDTSKQTWVKALQRNLALQKSNPKHAFNASPYELKKINVQAVDWFGERLGFVKFQAEVENEDAESLPGSVFLRGPSVAMMVVQACPNPQHQKSN